MFANNEEFTMLNFTAAWRIAWLVPAVMATWPASALDAGPLSIADAARLGADRDAIVRQFDARSRQDSEAGVAAGQLPDPQLVLGILSLPNSLNFNQENMTQAQVGLRQAFPPGDSLRYARGRLDAMSAEASDMAAARAVQVSRDVRLAYLEAWYYIEGQRIIKDTRKTYQELVAITTAQYGTGGRMQHDVFRAQLELSKLDEKDLKFKSGEEAQRGTLERWLGAPARAALDARFPHLPALPAREDVLNAIPDHPWVIAARDAVHAQEQSISEAREHYKPGWKVDFRYGQRSGMNANGFGRRDDFLSAVVSIDLPLFTAKRQDRTVSSRAAGLTAAQMQLEDHLRQLRGMLETHWSQYERASERVSLFQSRLLGDASDNSESTLNAYQSDVTDFTTLMRARIIEFEVRLQDLRARIDAQEALANLLYVKGDRA